MRKQLIECINIGYKDGVEERENEHNEDYESPFSELPIISNEAQYAYEFGLMMGREDMTIYGDDMDEYLEDILIDSDSDLTLEQLV